MPAYLPVPVQIEMIDRSEPPQLPVDTKDWRAVAECRDADPDLFFPLPNDFATAEAALSSCRKCPVRLPCRELRDSAGAEGVWGGAFYPTRTGRTLPIERECACGCGRTAQRGKQYHDESCRHTDLAGTVEGFRIHRKRKEAPCPACAEAESKRLAANGAWRRLAHREDPNRKHEAASV
jgi:hypothetical protein